MGAVFRPKDLSADRRKMAREFVKDLSPETEDNVLKIMDSWEGTKSEQQLEELLGHNKAQDLIKKIARRTAKNNSPLTFDQQNQVKDMFRESLTFD